MRLINADETLSKLKPCEVSDEGWTVTGGTLLRVIRRIIDMAPTIDAVPVIRCRDCIHYIAGYCCRDVKSRTNMVKYEPDDFCSYAVRRA